MPQSLAVIVKTKSGAAKRFLVVGCALAISAQSFGKEVTLYVSPKGNDSWSGTKADATWARRDGPFATLPAAINAARAARGQSKDARIKILLRGGVHELAQPIMLEPDDSGSSAKNPLIIGAYRNERPIVSGGRKISGWRRAAGETNLWSAEIPDVRDGKWYFRQLFVNGQRKQRARTPNTGFYHVQGNIALSQPATFKFAPGEIKTAWAGVGEVSGWSKWVNYRMQIRDVNEAIRTVTLSGIPHDSSVEPNSRYFIENAPDALDQLSEWFLDRHTGVVTYLAEPGEDLSKADVVAPRLTKFFELRGDFSAQKPVRHVRIENITFAYADWNLPETGYPDTQAAYSVGAAISGEGTSDCSFENCSFEHLGGYALDFGRGCQRMKVSGNDLHDLGAGGIRLGHSGPTPFEENHSHVITDNHIHRLGRVYGSAVGVLVLRSGTNHIAHNHIHDLFYTAISIGWNWGYEESQCRENIVEFNHLHDIGQGLLSDMGGIYTLGIQPGTILRNNLIHDVNSYSYGGWGLYTDEGSSKILMENNVVYRCKSAGFHQHYGRDNVLRNNIFAFNREHQLMRTRAEGHVSFYFTNNIVYFDSGQLLGSEWWGGSLVMDKNVYFDARPDAATNSIRFATLSLSDWQKRGHDINSIIADPQFVNAAKFDFRLKPSSPALKLGFKPVDVTRVGPRKNPERNR